MTARLGNRSTAVAARDDFPTQPWATRAFLYHVFCQALGHEPHKLIVWEPCANRRFMSSVLAESFGGVVESDVWDYGFGVEVKDFLDADLAEREKPHWIITNPPFNALHDWFQVALRNSRQGFALFGRVQMLESAVRYNAFYLPHRKHLLYAQHVDRVTLLEGRCVRRTDTDSSSATAYGWLVYDRSCDFAPIPGSTLPSIPFTWIPPCRKDFERDDDYEPRPRLA